MREIKLTKGKVTLVDDCNYNWLSRWRWYALRKKYTYYACRENTANGKRQKISMHRLILNTPQGMETDHINGDGLCNLRSNLRICTSSQNHQNQRKRRGSSEYKGVSWNRRKNKWWAVIIKSYIRIWLGCFDSEIQAAKSYDKAALKYFGEFAHLNFPEEKEEWDGSL